MDDRQYLRDLSMRTLLGSFILPHYVLDLECVICKRLHCLITAMFFGGSAYHHIAVRKYVTQPTHCYTPPHCLHNKI